MMDDSLVRREVEDQPPPPTKLREYALFAPRLVRLVWKLLRDPRVPPRTKAMLFLAAGYLVSPVDALPDFIPVLGNLDDVIVVGFVLDRLLNRVPEEVLQDHWDGDEDILAVVRQIADISTNFVPKWVRERF